MKLTATDVQEMSLKISVSHVKCMHEMKLTHVSKLLTEKQFEDNRNGLKMKLRIQWLFCFKKYKG